MMMRFSSSSTASLWRKWHANNFRTVSWVRRNATSKSNKDLVQKSEFDKKINALDQKIDKLLSKTISKSNKDLVQKSEFDKKINALDQKIDKLLSKTKGMNTYSTESTSAVANKVDQKIDGWNQKIEELLVEAKRMQKLLRLELALANLDFKKFEYFEEDDDARPGCGRDSANLAESIIQCFMLDQGYNLPKKAFCDDFVTDTCDDWYEEKFRDDIVKQIEALTGQKPRLVDNSDGSYTIYYS